MTSSKNSQATYPSFVAEAYTPHIGATIHGLDLSQPLSGAVQAELKAALAQYEVIFFAIKHSAPHNKWRSPAALAK